MNEKPQDLIQELDRLLRSFLSRSFKAKDAVRALGKPDVKESSRWTLKPLNKAHAEIILSFEDLEAGKGLLTTIQIGYTTAWTTGITELQHVWGEAHRWLPLLRPDGPKTLIFDLVTGELKAVVHLTIEPPAPSDDLSRLTVTKVMLRRFFPPPPKP